MTEQRWKWEICFTCGDKSSFLQYLLDNYTESDVVDMVTDIEDTKKAIEMQEKKIETGVTRSVLDGCTFEQEIRYVWRWCHDYQKILQIQDDISYVIVEDYF